MFESRGVFQRLRSSVSIRDMVQETDPVSLKNLVWPIFVSAFDTQPIESMPGIFQWSLKDLPKIVNQAKNFGIVSLLLFGIPKSKDAYGSANLSQDGVIQNAIKIIKDMAPEMWVISDICLCDYSDHGHCMIVDDAGQFDREKTLAYLANASLSHAKAGADMLAPSGMVDHMILFMRRALDENGFKQKSILSYSAKYASALYGPFRRACNSSPKFGDRLSYQMNPGNLKEAIKESKRDLEEGADMIMVKPAAHLDVIKSLAEKFDVPLAAYQVSGEYSMIKVAAAQKILDEQRFVQESLLSIKRAGASIILTYFALDFAKWKNS